MSTPHTIESMSCNYNGNDNDTDNRQRKKSKMNMPKDVLHIGIFESSNRDFKKMNPPHHISIELEPSVSYLKESSLLLIVRE